MNSYNQNLLKQIAQSVLLQGYKPYSVIVDHTYHRVNTVSHIINALRFNPENIKIYFKKDVGDCITLFILCESDTVVFFDYVSNAMNNGFANLLSDMAMLS